MRFCRQLTVPCTGCSVTSAYIDTPSSACLPESPVSVTYRITPEDSRPFLCPSCMCGIMYHDLPDCVMSTLCNFHCMNQKMFLNSNMKTLLFP